MYSFSYIILPVITIPHICYKFYLFEIFISSYCSLSCDVHSLSIFFFRLSSSFVFFHSFPSPNITFHVSLIILFSFSSSCSYFPLVPISLPTLSLLQSPNFPRSLFLSAFFLSLFIYTPFWLLNLNSLLCFAFILPLRPYYLMPSIIPSLCNISSIINLPSKYLFILSFHQIKNTNEKEIKRHPIRQRVMTKMTSRIM